MIKDLFLYPSSVQEGVFLHKSGDVFISPQEDFSLTVMGSRGTKQDLHISFADMPVAPITLEAKPSTHTMTDEALGQILLSFLGEEMPEEAEPTLFDDLSFTLSPHVTFRMKGAYKTQGITIFKGEVQNHSQEDFLLTPEAFPFAKLISFEYSVAKPKTHTTIYLIKKGDQNYA